MAAPRKLTPAKEKQVATAYQAGKSLAAISVRFGISAGTIRAVVTRAGLTLRPVGRPKAA